MKCDSEASVYVDESRSDGWARITCTCPGGHDGPHQTERDGKVLYEWDTWGTNFIGPNEGWPTKDDVPPSALAGINILNDKP